MITFLFIAGILKITVIFIAVIAVLILVHEAGHFIAAKLVGMRVDEFGLGFPPRLWGKKWGETEYTINALPLGGFVRIYGEDAVAQKKDKGAAAHRAFISRPYLAQAFVLVAGVAMNMVLAWIFITGALAFGTPRMLVVEQVLPNSPAAQAGFAAGDVITKAVTKTATWDGADTATFTTFIANDSGKLIHFSITRSGENLTLTGAPSRGTVPNAPSRYALGVGIITSGAPALSFSEALMQGVGATWRITVASANELAHFFGRAITLSANLSNVAGPIGIAAVVGGAAGNGLGYFLSILALISINLAIINLIPIPALDGGRLLFVIIEAVTRKKIPPRFVQTVNTVGFALIILLMVVVSVHDVYRLVS